MPASAGVRRCAPASGLFYNLQVLGSAARLVVGWRGARCLGGGGRRIERCDRIGRHRKRKSVAGFLGEDPGDGGGRDRHFLRYAVEASRELYPGIVDGESSRRARADVENNLAVLDVGTRHARLGIDLYGEVRREPVVGAPLADRTDEVGFRGLLGHGIRIHQPARGGTGSARRCCNASKLDPGLRRNDVAVSDRCDASRLALGQPGGLFGPPPTSASSRVGRNADSPRAILARFARGATGDAAGSRRYLRIPRSAEVSASMNAGRENHRPEYFISGAAGFGSWIP